MHKRGFTLLELLVVISIIAILVAISVASYGTVQKKGRDARRRADMKAVQDAFEQYSSKNAGYSMTCGDMATTEYLPSGLPEDPKPGWPPAPDTPGYTYDCAGVTVGGFTYDYCACARLENETGNSGADCDYQNVTKNYFCVSNLQ